MKYFSEKTDRQSRRLLVIFLWLPLVVAGGELPNPFSQTITDTLVLGLQEAILTGLENNPTVTIERLNPQIAQTYAREQRAVFDPEFSVTGQQSQSASQRRLGTRPTPIDLEDERFDLSVGIREVLPTGTVLSVNGGMTGSISNLYTDQYTGTVGLTLTQSLLQGFGFGANLARLRQARLDMEISQLELKGVAESVTAAIENAYWDLYLTEQEIDIQQQSLELARQQLAESLERVKVGKLPNLELAAVEAELAARRGALIDAQSRYEQARLQLLYLLNPQTENIWTHAPVLRDQPFLPTDSLDTVEIHEQLGLKFRPDLAQARLSLKKGDLELRRTKNGWLPRLDFFVDLGRTTYAQSFKEAYPDVQSPFYQATAGLSFVFPVPNREAAAQLQRARFSLAQQNLAVRNLEKLVQLAVRAAFVEVLRSRQQIEATRVTRELQQKKLAAELEKFRVGKSTNLLVLQAQRDFTTSQLSEAGAMVSYLNALVDLYLSEGTLLERRAVEFE